MKKIIERWPLLLVVLAAFVIGLLVGGGGSEETAHKGHQHEAGAAQVEEQTWTCSMHPQIRQPKAGKCPLCFMDLVPTESGETGRENPRELTLSPNAIKLAQVPLPTVPVTPTTGAGHCSRKWDTAEVIRQPDACASLRDGWSGRIPGDRKIVENRSRP